MTDRTPTVIEERGTAIDALVIQRRYVWQQRGDLLISTSVDATTSREVLDEIMDTINHIADREQLRVDLTEAEKAVRVAREAVSQQDSEERKLRAEILRLPRDQQEEIERIRAERAAYLSIAEQMWNRSNKRGEFDPQQKHGPKLKEFDRLIADLPRKYEDIKTRKEKEIENALINKKNFLNDIPINEWTVACIKAKIAGEEPPGRPSELEATIEELRAA